MSMNKDLILVFGGVAVVLILASATGWALKRLVARGAPHPGIDNLNARVRAWWLMVGTLGLTAALGKTFMILLFALLSLLALREFLTITPTRRGDHLALLVAFFVVLPIQYCLVAVEWYGLFSIFIPVYAFLLLPIVAALGADTAHFLERTSEIQWGLMIAVYAIS